MAQINHADIGDLFIQSCQHWPFSKAEDPKGLPCRYQFQSFAQYRGKLAQKTAEELDTLRTHEDVWSVLGVLNYLQALVDNSGIVAELSAPGMRVATLAHWMSQSHEESTAWRWAS